MNSERHAHRDASGRVPNAAHLHGKPRPRPKLRSRTGGTIAGCVAFRLGPLIQRNPVIVNDQPQAEAASCDCCKVR